MADPTGIARDAEGRIYVSNSATNTITIYAANANGNVPPIAVIGGSNARLVNPTAIALDVSEKIYVLNEGAYYGGSCGINVYPALETSTGILSQAPLATIAGPRTLLTDPTGIAVNSDGKIYVANELGGPVVRKGRADRGMLTIYAAGSSGNVAPIATISGSATGLAFPGGITLDSSSNIYVANFYTADSTSLPSITIYAAGSSGNAPPIATIAGDQTGLGYPPSIALDSDRNLYATSYSIDSNSYAVNVYPADSVGNAAPSATISGADTGLGGPNGLALDSSGKLYVSNGSGGSNGTGSVTIYAAGGSGDAMPIATISSSFTGIIGASSIAVDHSGKIYVANQFGGHGSIGIFPAGSYAAGSPEATIAGDNTGIDNPFAIALDFDDNLSVLNGDFSITQYRAGRTDNATPTATINVDSSGKSSPTGIAAGLNGTLYVANQGEVNCSRRSCDQLNPDSVDIYRAGGLRNGKPTTVIAGPATNLAAPSAIAVDRSGDIYVTNQGALKCTGPPGCRFCYPNGPGSVTVYAPGSSDAAKPIAVISGGNTGLGFPYGITLDSDRNIYVLNSTGEGFIGTCRFGDGREATTDSSNRQGASGPIPTDGPILIFAAGSNGNVAPIATIGGPFTGLSSPIGIAIEPASP